MANFCLLPDKVEEFKDALASRALDVRELMNMTTEERTKVFEQYAGDAAKDVNTAFEQKLVLKNRVLGVQNLLSKLGQFGKNSPDAAAEKARTIDEYKQAQTKRIFSPAEHEAFLNDLVDKKVGTHIDEATAKKVYELTQAVKAAKDAGTTNLSGVSDEYLKARQDLNNFIDAQKTISPARSIIQNLITIGRNNLLMNPATPIKSFEGQIVNGTIDHITRRLATLSSRGAVPELASDARAQAWSTFKKTGMNTAIMENLDDNHALGSARENFKVSNTGETPHPIVGAVERGVQTATKISNKIAIDLEHNIAFTKMYQGAFFDAANIFSGTFAKAEGLTGDAAKARSAEIFKDAARVEPETAEGALLRQQAQKAAARVTSTNDTLASNFATATKRALNSIIPGVPLGDLIIPIAKIPASIVANGIDNAGAGIPVAIRDIYQGRMKIQSDDLPTRYEGMAQFANGVQRAARIAGTMGVAFFIASQLQKSDYRTDQYGDSYVKFGNVWINAEYLSAISPALGGAVEAKFKGKGALGTPLAYVAGAAAPIKGLPGVDDASNLVSAITSTNLTKGVKQYASDFFTSRGVPAFIPNLLKNRPIDRLFFGASGVESTADVSADKKASAAKSAASRVADANSTP